MNDQGSKLYPCPAAYQGVWCGGIAALMGDRYVCQKCGWQWDQQGKPIIGKENNNK